MGRKNSPSANKELKDLIVQYETAKAENRNLYLDGNQLGEIADYYATEHRYVEAQDVIDYGLQLHPGNTVLLIEQAYLYLDTEQIDEAMEVADIITDEYDPDVKILKAELLLNDGQVEAAQKMLSTLHDDDQETYAGIIYLYLDMGYPEAAEEWVERGKNMFGESEDFMAVLADYTSATGKPEVASMYFNQLIDIEPFNPSYWVGLAKCYFAMNECDKAIEACDFALAADDKFGEAYSCRGHCYFFLNNADEAIKDYLKAIECKALPPEMGYMFLGLAYSSKSLWLEANECYQRVIDAFMAMGIFNSPLLIDTYINKAIACSALGNYKEAHKLCKKAREINPKSCEIYLTEGKIYLKEELVDKAEKAFKKALAIDKGAEMWYLVGDAYSDAELLYQAKNCYEKTYSINPQYLEVTEKLSILSLMHFDIDNFFKYNHESKNPITEDVIIDLLSKDDQTEEGEQLLKDVLERMKKENNNQ